MAIIATKYDQVPKIFLDGTVDLDTDTIKLALVTSSYTPSAAHTQWADISANETSGTGYTAGGETLANAAIDNSKFDADDVTWSTVTVTARYAVMYASKTANGLTNPVIGYYLLDDTSGGTDISPSAEDYTFPFNSAGIFTF